MQLVVSYGSLDRCGFRIQRCCGGGAVAALWRHSSAGFGWKAFFGQTSVRK